MSHEPGMSQTTLQEHVDVFVNNFFVNGARNHLRKTTRDATWMNVGIMERTNPEAFYAGTLFSGMNIVGGGEYSLGHGFIHGYLNDSARAHVKRAVAALNSLGAEEIILYHDESTRGLEMAREMGLELQFTPVSLLEWLVRKTIENRTRIRPLEADAAVQLPCSWLPGDGKNALIKELFDLLGIRRIERKYDFGNRLCCGARGYFGLAAGRTRTDSERSETQVQRNIEDAGQAGAEYLVTTCPYCFAAIASTAKQAGIVPIQIEGLVSLAVYDEALPEGLTFL